MGGGDDRGPVADLRAADPTQQLPVPGPEAGGDHDCHREGPHPVPTPAGDQPSRCSGRTLTDSLALSGRSLGDGIFFFVKDRTLRTPPNLESAA